MIYISRFAVEFLLLFHAMAPYLLLGFLVAGLLSAFVSPSLVKRHLGGRGIVPVLKAALVGVPLPLCSCGVIPVAASLRKQGAGRPATLAFLLSTPQTGVDSILVTYSLMGPVVAIFRPIAALVTGVVGGMLTSVFGERDEAETVKSNTECEVEQARDSSPVRRTVAALKYGFITLPRDIARPMAVGLAVAALISVAVPDNFLQQHLNSRFLGMLAALVVAIPSYVCATASVPIAAAMIAKGFSPGAAIVFLIAGPATNAATIATVWKVLGKRTAVVYLATVAACAMAGGALLDWWFDISGKTYMPDCHDSAGAFMMACSILLAIVMAVALLPSRRHALPAGPGTIRIRVKGMTCSHCEQTVREAVLSVPGVSAAEASASTGDVSASGTGLDRAGIKKAIEGRGYKVLDLPQD